MVTAPIHEKLSALESMTVAELRGEYLRVCGVTTSSHNRVWLVRRIAWRLQALAEGDLSERARQRAAELANDADLRLGPPRRPKLQTVSMTPALGGDQRRPSPGTILRRLYKGAALEVTVLRHGFEHDGTFYRTLSAVAKSITGSHCSGYGFFNLRNKEAS